MGRKDIKKYDFKKGQSGNPKGRPPKLVSSVLNELKEKGHEKVNKGAVREVYEYLIGLDQDELTKLASDKKTPMLFRIVAKNILSKKGFEIIEKMLDRAHGKATQTKEIELKGEVKAGLDLSKLSNDELNSLENIIHNASNDTGGEGKA